MAAFAPSSSWQPTGAPGSLEALCSVSKRACDILTPMIVKFYDAINAPKDAAGNAVTQKADKSIFTIADGIVQHLLVDHLYGKENKFCAIVGEEECAVDLKQRPFTVDSLTVPDEFSDIVESTRNQVSSLAQHLQACDLYRGISVFIDPIDGTREFSTNKGEQCSVCIGFSSSSGTPVAGLVYRPITNPPTWAAGAASEGYSGGDLDMATGEAACAEGLLTSNGSISPFIEALMAQLKYSRVPSGGAGNKMLMLLEKKGGAYIQDRGVSRWDTCAAQACIDAYGGQLSKLSSFMDGRKESYTYLKTESNTDFTPGVSNLTLYNCSEAAGFKKGDPTRRAVDVSEVKQYANLQGLFAVGPDKNDDTARGIMQTAAQAAASVSAPAYD